MSAQFETKLLALGAEHLAIARLLFHRVLAFKAPDGIQGFDVVATAPELSTSCRIQVKCRWFGRIDDIFVGDGFPRCDFLVLVASHTGHASMPPYFAVLDPEIYVFPADLLKPLVKGKSGVPKVSMKDLRKAADEWPEAEYGFDWFRENWGIVRAHLGLPAERPSSVVITGPGPFSEAAKMVVEEKHPDGALGRLRERAAAAQDRASKTRLERDTDKVEAP